jgi:hypothetical protein
MPRYIMVELFRSSSCSPTLSSSIHRSFCIGKINSFHDL